MSAPRSDGGGSAIWDLRAVRGPASQSTQSQNGKGRKPLSLKQRVLLVLVLMKEPFFVKGWLN